MKFAVVMKADDVRTTDMVFTEHGWVQVLDIEPMWCETTNLKFTFGDGEWETFKRKAKLLVLR